MLKTGYEMIVRPKGRTPADEYSHKGKIWIEGRENSNYVIELRNNTSNRVCAVVSVDGLGVMDGQPASYNSNGFIVDPHSTIEIPGWIVNNQTAAQFVFGKKEGSYAAYKDGESNVGVIGSAWFKEKPRYQYQQRYKGIVASGCSVTRSTSSVEQSLGTGWGENVNVNLTEVKFEKASTTPDLVMVVYYDSASNLQKMGIVLKSRYQNSPDAFPASSPKFCDPPPPSWVIKNQK